ncbi:methyltransferase domain-containing protein [Mycolicibacter sp. MYC123]|uniref:Methyltransferase domain-containing protein n=1 Tax=[Mycobacterium] zoologicum TaxID=2872311 RepID=A0ABU5YHQ5_9MYCO|nr:class I SAM-dependent methyltransferase [Mycolicibacter sp. MYC123]MEB3049345.1 methyltransferase domain-containing protein [Mycolicibacter sp. MYC123]
MTLPMPDRKTADLPGHWLFARLGKRVLRPGGLGLTHRMLADAQLSGADVVELAPGMGRTAKEILEHTPGTYTGVEADENAAGVVRSVVGDQGKVVTGEASETGLAAGSADVVIGEAMLTMQTNAHKSEIAREAFRVLRPGGRYAIHELALQPDNVPETVKDEVRAALARSIKVNARPLTAAEWSELLTEAGFTVEKISYAPMELLEPHRLIADEGLPGALRFVFNVLRDSDARARVLNMRSVFRKHRNNMAAIEVIAAKPAA